MQFDKAGAGDVEDTDLSHRYLWGPVVDQLFADEQVTSLESAGETLWAMPDHLGSVRDVVDSGGTLRVHRQFDTFGIIVDALHYDAAGDPVGVNDPGYVTVAFAFTGRWFDPDTGQQNNLHRWFDMMVGSWISEDPIGFAAGDANLYRYVGNEPTGRTDFSGLEAQEPTYGWWAATKGFVAGWYQGIANVANGLQDTAIGIANAPASAVNGIAWVEEKAGILDPEDPLRAPKIRSRDWSRDRITHEGGKGWGDTHNWSKFAGATGVTAGLSAWARAAQLARALAAAEERAIILPFESPPPEIPPTQIIPVTQLTDDTYLVGDRIVRIPREFPRIWEPPSE